MAWSTVICRRPRKRAEIPPVPVPTMKSKMSQGRSGDDGVLGVLEAFKCWSRSTNSRRMRSEERPRTPPPSKVRMRTLGDERDMGGAVKGDISANSHGCHAAKCTDLLSSRSNFCPAVAGIYYVDDSIMQHDGGCIS